MTIYSAAYIPLKHFQVGTASTNTFVLETVSYSDGGRVPPRNLNIVLFILFISSVEIDVYSHMKTFHSHIS